MRVAVGLLILASCLSGQVIYDPLNPPQFPPVLSQYLALTNSQKQAIIDNISAHNSWTIQKRRRIAEVKQEIEKETNKPALDPSAIGVRYAEIEAICRDIKDRVSQLRTQHINLLTDQQKSRLAALEQVLSLMPVVTEAQGTGMVGGTRYTVAIATAQSGTQEPKYSGALIGIPLIGPVTADTSCEAATVPVLDRIGSFAPSPTHP